MSLQKRRAKTAKKKNTAIEYKPLSLQRALRNLGAY